MRADRLCDTAQHVNAEGQKHTLTVEPAAIGKDTAPESCGLVMVSRASAEARMAGRATSAEGAGASSSAPLRCLRDSAALSPDQTHEIQSRKRMIASILRELVSVIMSRSRFVRRTDREGLGRCIKLQSTNIK